MEDVSPVLMHIDAFDRLCIHIATYVVAFVNHQYCVTLSLEKVSAYCAEETCAYNEVVIFLCHIVIFAYTVTVLLLYSTINAAFNSSYFKMLAIVTIIVAMEAADVPIAAYSAVVILFFLLFDGTTMVHPG